MKCFACGYSESVGAVPVDVIIRIGDMIPDGKYKFIPINVNYEKSAPDDCCARYGWQTLYACPNCGTVRMDTGC